MPLQSTVLLGLALCILTTNAWVNTNLPTTIIKNKFPITSQGSNKCPSKLLSTIDATEEETSSTTKSNLKKLKRDRYIATNRFSVRKGQEAKFEKRWVTRKSRLAQLDGFRYFHLMRRVKLNDDGVTTSYDNGHEEDRNQGNYVSFTIWKEKKHFNAWRNGDAFKEAHGGTSITAFLSTMMNSALVLNGPPRPAFYDGLLLQGLKPDSIPETEDGWRKVTVIDGQVLPEECFIACNQFFIPNENGVEFEQRWANRESKLKECDGFVSFSLLRRDGSAKGHGTVPLDITEPTYQSTTIWRDRAAFEAWKNGGAFKAAHGQSGGATPPKPLWSKPPEPVFYEGTLVISSEEGA